MFFIHAIIRFKLGQIKEIFSLNKMIKLTQHQFEVK
jgi:hypothetical protein